MPADVRVPVLGESVIEATVGAWLKQEGESVEAGEALVQLETEKVNVDVAADQSGILGPIAAQEGETVHPGDVLAVIEDPASVTPPPPSAHTSASGPFGSPASGSPASASASGPFGSPAAGSPAAALAAWPSAATGSGSAASASPAEVGESDRPHASPVARRMAEEHGVDLARVEGTGTGGRVTREDVERHIQGVAPALAALGMVTSANAPGTPATPTRAAAPGLPTGPGAPAASSTSIAAGSPGGQSVDGTRPETRIRLSRRRQTIASRLLEAQRTAAMLTTFNEVDMTAIMAIRARQRETFRTRHGIGLGFMSFFTKAVLGALREFPNLNSEIRGDEIIQKGYYDIGIAVGAEGGLVVPVVRDADRKTFAQLEQAIADLAEKARTNTLTLEDLRGGTFTITNGGVYGSLMSTPILSPPQVGILGMHKIQPRPIAVDGQVVIRPMMYLALTYDHRLVDGREAVQFLVRVKELIEDPTAMLTES